MCICKKIPDTKEASKWVHVCLNKLNIRCRHFDAGCRFELTYNELKTHEESQCELRMVSCDSPNCTTQMFAKDITAHNHLCPLRMINCRFCRVQFRRRVIGKFYIG
jgi:hypothetical protein